MSAAAAPKKSRCSETSTRSSVDFGVNIEACRARYDWGDWIGADLDDDDSPLPLSSLNDSIVVCADVIEHVVHPERLLRKLRDLLERGATALVLTTPERDLRRGRKHIGPSPNVAHVREWALDELRGFMADEGLEGYFGLTRTNDTAPYLHTIFAVIPGAGLGARAGELSRWWRYRERWQEIARRHEALIKKPKPGIVPRARRRLRGPAEASPGLAIGLAAPGKADRTGMAARVGST